MVNMSFFNVIVKSMSRLWILWLFLPLGCATTDVITEQTGSPAGIESILIIPFTDLTKAYGDSGMIKCPLCGNYFEAGQVPSDQENRLTDELIDRLEKQTNWRIITGSREMALAAETGPKSTQMTTERQLLLNIGRTVQADAVLSGYIYRYQERMGSQMAAERPASVAFSLHLIRTADGADVWSGYVDETQQALSENLLNMAAFWRRKGRWVSADEMADAGLDELIQKFPQP